MRLSRTIRDSSVALLVAAIVWMDVCLYYHIQAMRSVQNQTKPKEPGFYFSQYLSQLPILSTDKPSQHDTLRPVDAQIESVSTMRNHLQAGFDRLPAWIAPFSFAFHGLSVKLMMSDPMDNYLLGPLAEALEGRVNFRDNLKYVSANMVSAAGVVSGLISAKLVTSRRKWLAFGFFQLRNWFDCLDGLVARSRLGITQHASLDQTFGYLVDGLCDAISFLAFVWAIYVVLRRSHFVTYRTPSDKPISIDTRPNYKRLALLVGLFLVQLALCSAGWNTYILKYRQLLESSPVNVQSKLRILKSNIMFVLIWLWRMTNGHSFMQMLAISMLMNRAWQFLEWIKFVGLIEILLLVLVTHLHTIDTANYLSD